MLLLFITAAPYSVNEQTHVIQPFMSDRIHRTKVLLYDKDIAKRLDNELNVIISAADNGTAEIVALRY
jgi:hypothetical protein